MDWTPEVITEVRRLATRDSKSASEIAAILGNGVTRNMVISLATRVRPRIKLSGGTPEAARAVVPMKALGQRPRFVIIEEVFEPLHQNQLRANDQRCRMPLWPDRMWTTQKPEAAELMYCGKKTKPDSPWCDDCRARVYVQTVTKTAGPGSGRKYNRDGRRAGWQYGT